MLFLLTATGSAHADRRSDAVDRLFSQWDTPTTPGANVLILRDGEELYSRSYGMAHVALSQKNAPDLVYPIGSVTKQFTGYGIQLLAHEGKLSLADDVRRYLPEVPAFGQPITLAMLLNHSSGLRDNVPLLVLKGHRMDDVTSAQDSFDVIKAQTGLNFPPGSRYLYSNANYVLLAKVIERVSGLSYAEFLRQHVFAPFGLTQTRVVTDPVSTTPGLAMGYGSRAHVPQSSVDSTYGSTGILATIGDMGRWSTRFHAGGDRVFAAMAQPGILSDGIPITYASGLHAERFHDLPYVEHTGAVPGFHSDILVFPQQRLSIVLLANTDQIDAAGMAFAIAEIYLKESFQEPPPSRAASTPPDVATVQRYVGTYEILSGTSQMGPGRRMTFTLEGRVLLLAYEGKTMALTASSDVEFFSASTDVRVGFRPAADAVAPWIAVRHDKSGSDFAARRITEVAPPAASVVAPPAAEGLYYSDELNTVYRVRARGEEWLLQTPRGDVTLNRQPDGRWAVQGDFDAGTPAGSITFTQRGSDVSGFLLTMQGGRAANVYFGRTATPPSRP